MRQYIIVTALETTDLAERVQELLAKGGHLVGGVTTIYALNAPPYLGQAMTMPPKWKPK